MTNKIFHYKENNQLVIVISQKRHTRKNITIEYHISFECKSVGMIDSSI